MKRLIPLSICAALLLVFALPAAHAQATRTWVSGVGDDANPCSRTAPCKTFAGAISKTATGGEINVLDPGGFGGVTITKSITISSEGFEAGVLVSGTNAIVVNATSTSLVILRGLDIEGLGTGLTGIKVLQAGSVLVENCTVRGFTQFAIDVNGPTNAKIQVSDTRINDITLSAVHALGALTRTSLTRVLIHKAGFGFDVTSGVGTIGDSTISGVTNQAIVAQGAGTINVDGGVVFNSGTGVSAASSGSTVRIANLAILNNTTGINIAAGGTVASFGGNKNAGNTTPGAPNANIPLQ